MVTAVPPKKPHRREAKPRPVFPAPPPTALAVVSVEVVSYDGADMHLVLTFNTTAEEPLADLTAADPAKWTARMDGVPYLGDGGAIELLTYNTVALHLLGNTPGPGPDVINYSNAPSDVADAAGRQLAAFSGFPLVP